MTGKAAAGILFDAHVHIFAEDRRAFPILAIPEAPPPPPGSAERLIAEMDRAGVAKALLVQTPWYGEDNRYFVASMRRHPGRFAAIGYCGEPFVPEASDRLERQYHEDGFRGLRLHLANPWRNAPDPRIVDGVHAGAADSLFRKARELGITVQFLNRIPTHPTILAVADRFPDLTIVVDHLAHPYVAEAPGFASSATFFELAKRPNVYVKISNHVMHSRMPSPWRDLHDYQRRVVDRFGPERLMWGSNWPMDTPRLGYQERLDAVRIHLPFLSAEDRAVILGGTARRLWP
jgi:predicted TIM-barrel fold metal-dependent hydrolase